MLDLNLDFHKNDPKAAQLATVKRCRFLHSRPSGVVERAPRPYAQCGFHCCCRRRLRHPSDIYLGLEFFLVRSSENFYMRTETVHVNSKLHHKVINTCYYLNVGLNLVLRQIIPERLTARADMVFEAVHRRCAREARPHLNFRR